MLKLQEEKTYLVCIHVCESVSVCASVCVWLCVCVYVCVWMCVCAWSVCIWKCLSCHACGGHKSWFSPSTFMWLLGIELGWSGLCGKSFTLLAILLVPLYKFKVAYWMWLRFITPAPGKLSHRANPYLKTNFDPWSVSWVLHGYWRSEPRSLRCVTSSHLPSPNCPIPASTSQKAKHGDGWLCVSFQHLAGRDRRVRSSIPSSSIPQDWSQPGICENLY